ncbi:membrane-bound lytic murein transglycosylase MltF [Aidingimonas lacisalsi]|uniref:membrane-bound lytic murein transglycosylase MltF n=1 Tax=Aidingimonas lacisalsi TaxID=2604086 RepID=UPI0011D2829C|nr:membrane-bound lytic murein transglycosylase MltF [Aidingimonas lacisalsi]
MPKALLSHLLHYRRWYLLPCFTLLLALIPDRQFSHNSQHLADIKQRDFLSVFTRNTPTTYYEGRHGPTGFEYELLQRFADYLGVSLSMETRSDIQGVLDAVLEEQGDLGAAALPLDPADPDLIYSQPILRLQPLVVYSRELPPVTEPADLIGLEIATIRGSGTSMALRKLQDAMPELTWHEATEVEVADLLGFIEEGRFDAAVIHAHDFKYNRLFFPGVEDGFTLGEPLSMSWAFPADQGLGLQQAANRFLSQLKNDGILDELISRHFGHDDYLEYVGARRFIRHVRELLPKFSDLFREAARETGFDWKLLAALGYQESHWDPEATSPTGVRGLMMLTNPTAEEVDVDNRLDPAQSIHGGARYLREVMERLPEEIEEPDRLWMALAAYNVGLGHLYDAQEIAEMRDGDPNRWADVREALPLLQNQKWHSRVSHGYARGGEPVVYVRNIRRYYEILNYVDRSQQQFYQLDEPPPNDNNHLFDTVPPIL